MSNNLYEQIKEVIKEHKACLNYNWFENVCPHKEPNFWDAKEYPYFEEVCEKEREMEFEYQKTKIFEHESKNRIYYEGNLYNNNISINLNLDSIRNRYTNENKVSYSLTTKYVFDKEFIKKQNPIYMIWFVNKFNYIYHLSGGQHCIVYPLMDYEHETNMLSVYTRLDIEESEKFNFYDIKNKVNEFLAIGTLSLPHFNETIYECIDYAREGYEVAVEEFLYKLTKANMPSGDELIEQYINMFEKTYIDFINESKDCGLEQYRDDEFERIAESTY